MSAPLAGKFQDHYEVLEVDPRAEAETIQRAYASLAQKYRPEDPAGGDPGKLQAVKLAYEVLSDPVLRQHFDKVKGIDAQGAPKFNGTAFFEALGRESGLRLAVLCVLYDRRRARPSVPGLSLRQLDSIVASADEEMNFALWYLKQRGLAASDDKSNLLITVEGMDFLEATRPSPAAVLPFIKAGGLAEAPGAPAAPRMEAPAAEPAGGESVSEVLRRVLAIR